MKSPHLRDSQFFAYYAQLLEAVASSSELPTALQEEVLQYAAGDITDKEGLQAVLTRLRRAVWQFRDNPKVRNVLDILIMALQALEELLRSKAMLGKVEK